MTQRIRPYLAAFRLRALLETQYRAAALGGLVTQVFFGLVLVSLYRALYAGSDPQALAGVVTYVWLQQAFFRAIFSADSELTGQILSGSIAYTLVRPVDQQLYWFFRDLATKLVGCFMRLAPMLAIQLFLPDGYRMALPASPLAFMQFLASLALGFLCLTQIASITSACTMITLDPRGLAALLNLTMAILAGNIIPLTLFPDRVQALVRYQPFAQALDAPIRMYQQAQGAGEFLLDLGVQLAWLAVLTIIARTLWQRHLRRLVVQGG